MKGGNLKRKRFLTGCQQIINKKSNNEKICLKPGIMGHPHTMARYNFKEGSSERDNIAGCDQATFFGKV